MAPLIKRLIFSNPSNRFNPLRQIYFLIILIILAITKPLTINDINLILLVSIQWIFSFICLGVIAITNYCFVDC